MDKQEGLKFLFWMVVILLIGGLWRILKRSVGKIIYESSCRASFNDDMSWGQGTICVYEDFVAFYGMGGMFFPIHLINSCPTKTIQFDEIENVEIISSMHGPGLRIVYKRLALTENVKVSIPNPEKLKRVMDSRLDLQKKGKGILEVKK